MSAGMFVVECNCVWSQEIHHQWKDRESSLVLLNGQYGRFRGKWIG